MKKTITSSLSRKICLALALIFSSASIAQNLPTAVQTAKAMTMGWNLGNTLEAIGGETAWGNPLTTQRLIDSVKAAGFNTIRIPCAWDIHANQNTKQIDAAWIARVKQVVDYCIGRNLYVILNIHWDNGWLENNCTEAKKNEVNAKQNTYWTQIANYFKGYDGRLLFASANEPDAKTAAEMAVLLSYHQTFINTVRSTGGNNSSRVLIIQGPKTDVELTNQLMNTLPTDQISNRLMVEVHYYTPWNFCGLPTDESWGKMFYYWGNGHHSTADPSRNATWGEESTLDAHFQMMKSKFSDKGIPVIIGEFGAIKRTSLTGSALSQHIASREYFYWYIAKASVRFGIPLVYWDAGFLGNNSFTLFNRNTGRMEDRGAVNALMKGAGINPTVTALDEEAVIKSSIRVGPNPFNVVAQIESDIREAIIKVNVLDLMGNTVESIENTGLEKSITVGNNLKTGTYIVQVLGEQGVKSFTLIKK